MSRFALALGLALWPAAAGAAALDTPPAFAGAGSNVQCIVRNFDTKTREVTVTMLDQVGAAAEGPLTIEVGAGSTIDVVNAGGASPYVTCRFEGLTRKVRGWLAVLDGGGTRTMLPAAK
jgi:hypothetical protein